MKNNIKKSLLISLISITIFSCKFNEKVEESKVPEENIVEIESTDEEMEAPILLGVQNRAKLETEPYEGWFKENYNEHSLDSTTINTIKSNLSEVGITIFMGTWCEDSQRETPSFYKVLDYAGVNTDDVKLITVSEDKDTPEDLEDGLNITNVPTFIFTKDGNELGRIVEYPLESLEKDMTKILTGQEYKHAYAE